MVYREPDPKRAHEAEDDEENREALERLARAGMRKQQALAEARADRQLRESTRATSKRFRERALRGPRYFAFVGFWLGFGAALSMLVGLVELIVKRDLVPAVEVSVVAFVIYNLSALGAFPLMIVFGIWRAMWRRRDARDLVAWNARLPFPIAHFETTLSLDHTLDHVRVCAWFSGEAPAKDLVQGLVGNLPRAEQITVQIGKRGVAITADVADSTDSYAVPLIVGVAEKVLLPLHAVHAIERTTIQEAKSSDTWESGGDAKAVIAALD